MRGFDIGAHVPQSVRHRRAAFLGAGVLLVGLVLPFIRHVLTASAIVEEPPIELIPGVPYAVAVRAERASFDLNFSSNARYVVVIGSLGPAERRFEVECCSNEVPATCVEPISRVFPAADVDRSPGPAGDDGATRAGERESSDQPASAHDIIPVSLSQPPSTAADTFLHAPIPASSRAFSLHVTDGTLDDPAQYATIHAKPIAEGRQVRVYLDDQQSTYSLAPGLVQDVVDLFDRDIIPRFRGLLGTYRDIDHDGRFAVLLSPWLSRLQGGRTSVGGFVRGSDFQTCLSRPFSNRCDMMYVNSQTLPGPHLRTLLIHEYTHAVCFSRRTADALGRPIYPEEEDWLNEAIAHCAESIFGGGWSNLDYRIARFLNDPAAFPLVVADYYRAGLWRCHGCRGATYLFLRYCLERFGSETLNRLVANPAHGTHNLELATGCSFEQLFRGWTLSLVEAALRREMPEKDISGKRTSARPALSELDIYGSLGSWGLAGPRRLPWIVDGESKQINLKGTSAAYLELSANQSPGPRRLCLKGSPGSKIQVSVVRLEEASPQIELEVAWSSIASGKTTAEKNPAGSSADRQPAGGDCLHTSVRFLGGQDLMIEQIALEQNSAETHASMCFLGTSLAQFECDQRAATARSMRPMASRFFDLPTTRLSACDVPIVVKVVAVDRRGIRTSAWAIVNRDARPQGEHLARLAR